MNRKVFFDYVRRAPFGGRLTTGQVDGLTKILDEWGKRKLTDNRWLAYILATVFHETGTKIQPVRENGGEKYLKSKKYYPWVGEGLVQATWETNHRKFGATKPGQLMTWPIALVALFEGMTKGMFSGKKLSDYFNKKIDDPVGARLIVNGRDKANLIALYHKNFLDAITKAQEVPDNSEGNKTVKVETEDLNPSESPGTLATATAVISGLGGVGALGNISNPYAFGAFALLIVAIGAIGYAIFSKKLVIQR